MKLEYGGVIPVKHSEAWTKRAAVHAAEENFDTTKSQSNLKSYDGVK
jgi:hypothetical protein